MKRLLWTGLTACLAGCAPMVESDKALFTACGGQPRPGLWAMLDEGCATPRGSDVSEWPECAAPVWVKGASATAFLGGGDPESFPAGRPVKVGVVVAEGDPYMLQLQPPRDQSADEKAAEYVYMALRPDGASPFERARVWTGLCPDGAAEDGGSACRAQSSDQVRGWLSAAISAQPSHTAVWVAP